MIRRVTLLTAALIGVLPFANGNTHAQYFYPYGEGYGGYGFGGWGQTPQGSMAAGMGAFAAGAGQYNYNTAVARSINANTAMQWNNYIWAAQHSLNISHHARMIRERQQVSATADAIEKRLRENPNDVDIQRGDALNAIREQLTYPKVLEGSGLARATGQIPTAMVKAIPFRYAPEMAVICIDRIRNDIPELLKSDAVKSEREAFASAVRRAVNLIRSGDDVPPELVTEVRTTGRTLYSKVETGLPDAPKVQRDKALTYLKNLKALLRMLKSPDFSRALNDLNQYQGTTVGNLIAFMHTYNLRFGPATTQEQQANYRRLYPILRADRDKVLNRLGPSAASETGEVPLPPSPGAIFQGMEDKNLSEGTGKN